jgi:hypothetical protein
MVVTVIGIHHTPLIKVFQDIKIKDQQCPIPEVVLEIPVDKHTDHIRLKHLSQPIDLIFHEMEDSVVLHQQPQISMAIVITIKTQEIPDSPNIILKVHQTEDSLIIRVLHQKIHISMATVTLTATKTQEIHQTKDSLTTCTIIRVLHQKQHISMAIVITTTHEILHALNIIQQIKDSVTELILHIISTVIIIPTIDHHQPFLLNTTLLRFLLAVIHVILFEQ